MNSSKSIKEWSDLLAARFSNVKSERARQRPIFALEHGLNKEEIGQLKRCVRQVIRSRTPTNSDEIPLIVYASELGYEFKGLAYWPMFEGRTPGWLEHGDRYWLRAAFQRFSMRFGGAIPQGSWAEIKSIIAWPITHAILPLDAQRHLAKILYDLSFSLRAYRDLSPSRIGRLVEQSATYTSNRFRDIATQTNLIGQISLALIEEKEFASEYLSEDVIDRIVGDLGRERIVSEYLEHTRKSVRPTLKGIRSTRTDKGPSDLDDTEITSDKIEVSSVTEPEIGIEAREVNGIWSVYVKLPSLRPLSRSYPELRNEIESSRIKVAGVDESRVFPTGYLLYGEQLEELSNWPSPHEQLLSVPDSPRLNHLLRALSLSQSDRRLFRIDIDGVGHEVKSGVVRPGKPYLQIDNDSRHSQIPGANVVPLSLETGVAIRFDVPEIVSSSWLEAAKEHGIRLAAGISVWPCGMPPTEWDGEGRAVWLMTDTPSLGVMSQTSVKSITISCGNNLITLREPIPSKVYFIKLIPETARSYSVEVAATYPDGQISVGYFDCLVKQPLLSESELVSSPIHGWSNLPDPSLEEIISGDARLTVSVAASCTAKVKIEFFEFHDVNAFFTSNDLPSVSLPFSEDDWWHYFRNQIVEKERFDSILERASAIRIAVVAGLLGTYRIRAERRERAVRWINDGGKTRLVDERSDSDELRVYRLPISEPSQQVEIDPSDAELGCQAPGLWRFISEDCSESVVVLPDISGQGLEALQKLHPTCQFESLRRSADSIRLILREIEFWGEAFQILPAGPRAAVCQHVLEQAATIICRKICDSDKWTEIESLVIETESEERLRTLKKIIPKKNTVPNWERYFPRDDTLVELTPSERARHLSHFFTRLHWLSSVPISDAIDYKRWKQIQGPKHPEWLSEFALRLASAPNTLEDFAPNRVGLGLHVLLDHPEIVRSARYLTLSASIRHSGLVTPPVVYGGWKWN